MLGQPLPWRAHAHAHADADGAGFGSDDGDDDDGDGSAAVTVSLAPGVVSSLVSLGGGIGTIAAPLAIARERPSRLGASSAAAAAAAAGGADSEFDRTGFFPFATAMARAEAALSGGVGAALAAVSSALTPGARAQSSSSYAAPSLADLASALAAAGAPPPSGVPAMLAPSGAGAGVGAGTGTSSGTGAGAGGTAGAGTSSAPGSGTGAPIAGPSATSAQGAAAVAAAAASASSSSTVFTAPLPRAVSAQAFVHRAAASAHRPGEAVLTISAQTASRLLGDLHQRCTASVAASEAFDLRPAEKKFLKKAFMVVMRDSARVSRAKFKQRLLGAGLDPSLPFLADKLFRALTSPLVPYMDLKDFSLAASITLTDVSAARALLLYHVLDIDEDGVLSVQDLFSGLLLGLHKQLPNDYMMLTEFIRGKLASIRPALPGAQLVAEECVRLRKASQTLAAAGVDVHAFGSYGGAAAGARGGGDMAWSAQDAATASLSALNALTLTLSQGRTGLGFSLLPPAEAAALTSYWTPDGPMRLCGAGPIPSAAEINALAAAGAHAGTAAAFGDSAAAAGARSPGSARGGARAGASPAPAPSPRASAESDPFLAKSERLLRAPGVQQWVSMMQQTAPDPQHVYITPMEMVELVRRWDGSDLIRLLQLALLWPDMRTIRPSEATAPVVAPAVFIRPWDEQLLHGYRQAQAAAGQAPIRPVPVQHVIQQKEQKKG
jgi:Ca2+-binding EF-hand superfamily protein